FDVTPCGGTHCTRTAQVGPIRLLDAQKHRGGLRVTFTCGRRTRRVLYGEANALRELARRFSCAPTDVPDAVRKLDRQLKDVRDALGSARAGWAEALAEALAKDGSDPLVRVLEGLDRDALRGVAMRLAQGSRLVALAAPGADGLAVVIARGAEGEEDCGALLRAITAEAGGGGGGRPARAEGKLPAGADWPTLVSRALVS
ncbi:MAG: DHHA1 domain-containing protein, partial [Myxococcota bacterium]